MGDRVGWGAALGALLLLPWRHHVHTPCRKEWTGPASCGAILRPPPELEEPATAVRNTGDLLCIKCLLRTSVHAGIDHIANCVAAGRRPCGLMRHLFKHACCNSAGGASSNRACMNTQTSSAGLGFARLDALSAPWRPPKPQLLHPWLGRAPLPLARRALIWKSQCHVSQRQNMQQQQQNPP